MLHHIFFNSDGEIISHLPVIPDDAEPVGKFVDWNWTIQPVYGVRGGLACRREDGHASTVPPYRLVDDEMEAVYRSFAEEHEVEARRLVAAPDRAIFVHLLKGFYGHVRPYLRYDIFRLVPADGMVLPGVVDYRGAYRTLQEFLCDERREFQGTE